MVRQPTTKEIATRIRGTKVGKKLTVAGSVAYLAGHGSDLADFDHVDDLSSEMVSQTPSRTAQAMAFHLQVVRNELARELWQRGVGVGLYTLDELLFAAVKQGEQDALFWVLEQLHRSPKNAPGLVIFPLHSLGVIAAGLLKPLRKRSYALIRARDGFGIISQTNDFEHTLVLLDELRSGLGVRQELDESLIRHWHKSRGANWLERNPLLVARMTTISGQYYDTEFLTLSRLQVATAGIVMLAALQPPNANRQAWLLSSRGINNWETLDIHHYLVLTAGRGPVLSGDAVPIHNRAHVLELASLAVDLNPRFCSRDTARTTRVFEMLERLHSGYVRHSLSVNSTLGNTYRKIMGAVTFFRRSFQSRRDDWADAVSLATAFEMLLTDQYGPGVKNRLRTRTESLLRGVPGTRRFQAAIVNVYEARSERVHHGADTRVDLADARQAFVLCFLELMRRLPTLAEKQPNPMEFLTGP